MDKTAPKTNASYFIILAHNIQVDAGGIAVEVSRCVFFMEKKKQKQQQQQQKNTLLI